MSTTLHTCRIASFLVAAALAGPVRSGEAPSGMELYRIEQDGGGLGYFIDETVAFSKPWEAPPLPDFWWAERLRKETFPASRPPTQHQWIDGRTCPALKQVLDRIATLPPVRMGAPDTYVAKPPPTDTPQITLHAPPADHVGSGVWLTRSEYDGPVARWWAAGEKALAGCWSAEPVRIDGQPVRSRLVAPSAP